jgi:hypothetical protein
MTTQERLNELLDLACTHYGAANDAQLAKFMGLPNSTIWRWRTGAMLSTQAEALLSILNLAFPGPLPIAAAADTHA